MAMHALATGDQNRECLGFRRGGSTLRSVQQALQSRLQRSPLGSAAVRAASDGLMVRTLPRPSRRTSVSW